MTASSGLGRSVACFPGRETTSTSGRSDEMRTKRSRSTYAASFSSHRLKSATFAACVRSGTSAKQLHQKTQQSRRGARTEARPVLLRLEPREAALPKVVEQIFGRQAEHGGHDAEVARGRLAEVAVSEGGVSNVM